MKPSFTVDEWPRIAELFDHALSLEADDRQAWLVQLQQTEPGLAPHVEQLLGAHAGRETADWLERGPQLPAAAP
ncbi:MAG TPA: hypothetical protein PLA97_11370, partial [Rubrivivax sp.]|nr:hypothetical protein [Rubrivivax sp.]